MKKIISGVLVFLLGLQCFAQSKKADFVFMHDVHSFLDEAAKAKVIIDQKKAENPDTFVLDAGDFSMGTLYQTIFSSHAAELRTLGLIGVEATTLGNHEFDYGAKGLSDMFAVAKESGDKVPQLVLCNVDWAQQDEYTKTLKRGIDFYCDSETGTKPYIMIKKGDLNVAVIGVEGADSIFCSPTCKLTFLNQYDAVKNAVQMIKEKEQADMIVCLSHSGTNKNLKKSEDHILAKKVPEIDFIISGHTHTVIEKPFVVGETTIASCGSYLNYLGNISFSQKENGRWEIRDYELVPLRGVEREEDSLVKTRLEEFSKTIDKEYLSLYGLKSQQVIFNSPVSYDRYKEVGYLMADCHYAAAKKLGVPVDFAIVPSGVLRDTYRKGDVNTKMVFESYSLGIGEDRLTGYPLVKVWAKGSDLRNVMEVDASLFPMLSTVRLFAKGLAYKRNDKRLFLNRVTQVMVYGENGYEPCQDDKLYCTVTDLYTGQMLGQILGMTKGLLTIIPRYENGDVITDFSTCIIHDETGKELKGWAALADELENFAGKVDYSEKEAETVIYENSLAPSKIFFNPSKFAQIVYTAVLVILFVIAAIIFVTITLKQLKKKKS